MQEVGSHPTRLSLENEKEGNEGKEVLKKVLKTTWSGSDESELEEERINICFMTKSDLKKEVDNPKFYSLFELQEKFDSLLDEYTCISTKNKSLKKQLALKKNEIETLTHDHNKTKKELDIINNEKVIILKEMECIRNENKELKKKVSSVKVVP